MGAFRSYAERIRRWTQRLSVKKRFLMVGMCLLLVTPLLLTAMYVYQVRHETENAFSVSVYDRNEKEIVFQSGNPDEASPKSLVGIFYRIVSSTQPLKQAPGDPKTDPYVIAQCSLNGSKSKWRCYFSFLESDSYCIAEDGSIYAIDATLSKNFLSSDHAESFYSAATPPALLTIDNDPVLPSTVNWHYRNRSDVFLEAKQIPSADQNRLYEMTGELGLRFETDPDICEVAVFEKDQEIFHGSYDELSSLTASSGTVMRIQVHAEWIREGDTEAYGNLEYDFSVQIRNQSLFLLDTKTVSPGGFAVLSCTNITELSKIKFSPLTDGIIPSPIFHRDGAYVRALLAFPEDTEIEKFSFSIAYGASVQDFSLTIVPKAPSQERFYSQWEPRDTLLTQKARDEVLAILSALPSDERASLYFQGNFLDPEDQGYSVGYLHGDQVYYGSLLDQSFTALGSEYRSEAGGSRVLTLNHGVVLKIGECELLGQFIIVDHGGGLRTWYCHLSDLNVGAGDVVKKGDILGWTGNNGLATGSGMLILCTVYDAVIDPDSIIGKEIFLQELA